MTIQTAWVFERIRTYILGTILMHMKMQFVMVKYFKKYFKQPEKYNFDDNLLSAIITPDKDIIPGSKVLSPAYIVFNNYEKVLKWNRSLRFALAVCTLKDKFQNEI